MSFRRAAQARWNQVFGPTNEGHCEECMAWIDPRTVPHHTGKARGGLGGKRVHDPDLLRFLCARCHDKQHGVLRIDL